MAINCTVLPITASGRDCKNKGVARIAYIPGAKLKYPEIEAAANFPPSTLVLAGVPRVTGAKFEEIKGFDAATSAFSYERAATGLYTQTVNLAFTKESNDLLVAQAKLNEPGCCNLVFALLGTNGKTYMVGLAYDPRSKSLEPTGMALSDGTNGNLGNQSTEGVSNLGFNTASASGPWVIADLDSAEYEALLVPALLVAAT